MRLISVTVESTVRAPFSNGLLCADIGPSFRLGFQSAVTLRPDRHDTCQFTPCAVYRVRTGGCESALTPDDCDVANMRRMREEPAQGRLRLTLPAHPFCGRGTGRQRRIPLDPTGLFRREMMTKLSSWTLATAAAVSLCALAGCNKRESAQETAQDVAEERQDAQENVAEERREAADVATENVEDRAAAEYDVAVAQADGQRKIAQEKCETLGSDAQEACKDQAEATYESAKAQAQATLDAAKRSGSAEIQPAN